MNIQLLYRLAKHLSFYKKDLTIVMVSLLSVSASLLLIGSIFRNLVDNGLSQNLISSINKSILYICVLVVILSVASFFRSYFINNVAEKVASRIKKEAYSNLINYEIAEFEEIKIGDIISRLTHDIDQIAKLIVNILSFFIRNSVMLIGGIVLMFFESFKLASIVIITIPLLLFPIIKFGKHVKALSKKALEAKSLLASDIDESFYNIKAIYAFNNQANRITNFNNHLQGYLSSSADRLKIRALFFAFSMALIFLSVTLVIWIGASDIVKGHLSAGQIISFIYYAIIAGFSSGGIFELLSEIHLPLAALERIFKITDKSPIACSNYLAIRSTDSISLEFKDVSFTYHSRPHLKILNNLSFKIDSRHLSKLAYREEFKGDTSLRTAAYINVREDEGLGSTSKLPLEVEFRKMSSNRFIGIVGRSGSGKSTLIQLLLRFYNQDSGQIFINNQDIAFLNPFEVRKLIAYVPQEASIFSGTIKSNILCGNTEISEKEIAEITKITGIDEFASKTLQGINTEIGEKGVRLSGGQKQRIALARALLRKPDILLLDEAMSAIDSESEHQLLESIKEIMKGKIIISIAHRISSIESADNILIIDKGELVAEGSHNNLLKNSEFYRTLCREQLT